jgi:hypothetical protein
MKYAKNVKAKKQSTVTPKRTVVPLKGMRGITTIGAAEKKIEAQFALPKGSVRLIYRTGRKARSDSTVGLLVKHWADRR